MYEPLNPPDALDEMVAESTARNPKFPELLEQAIVRRALASELAERRRSKGLSQTQVAAAMETSQSALARVEAGETDTRLSTLQRQAMALGLKIQFRLIANDSDEPAVVSDAD